MSVLVVGKNSFLGRSLKSNVLTSHWSYVSHEDVYKDPTCLHNRDAIINCSFPPDFRSGAYREAQDIDSHIAMHIAQTRTHYVMISSRLVYGAQEIIDEDIKPMPDRPYGENKHIIEQSLAGILPPAQLTILRCSNVFGVGASRMTFVGSLAHDLTEKGHITLDIAGATRKDFLPVATLCHVLEQVVTHKHSGLYNMAANVSVGCEDVVRAFIDGFGRGTYKTTGAETQGQFFINDHRIYQKTGVKALSEEDILTAIRQAGRDAIS